MIHVLLTPPFREEDLSRFTDLPGFSFTWSHDPDPSQLKNAEVLLGNPNTAALSLCDKLRWLQLPMAGVDYYFNHRDAFPRNVTLTCLSGAFGRSISEFALTMCLMLYKHMGLYRDNQSAHLWQDMGRQDSPVGKHVLILGAGNIGCDTARLFKGFDCKITGVRRTPRALPENFDAMITLKELDQVLPSADIVICALPGTEATYKLFNRERLGLLHPKAVLINVGRGTLIDTDALTECLQQKRIRGAALDVTDPEPLPPEHPLWDCPNVILTPHITGGTFGHLTATEEVLYDLCRKNLIRYQEGMPLLNQVDLSTGYRHLEDRYPD